MDEDRGKPRSTKGGRAGSRKPRAASSRGADGKARAPKRARAPDAKREAAGAETAEGFGTAVPEPPRKARKPRAEAREARQGDGFAGTPLAASETVSAEERRRMIAERAYLRAERRGFVGGDPIADWLEEEREVDRLLAQSRPDREAAENRS